MIRDRRPLVLSRYGGIGNQRYGIGFSGDTQSTWATLKLQVAMTPTAANVLFGYWSHDIGGYNIYCPINGTNSPCQCGEVVQPCNLTTSECGRSPGDLYTRWLQFGAVSPILRPHCSHCDKRIWMYPPEFYAAMRAALLFRQALRPYLYSAAREAVDTAVVALRPLYYEWPAANESYTFAATQYLLGPSLLAAPATDAPGAAPGGASVWLPPGRWLAFDGSSAPIAGPATLAGLQFGLADYGLFARAGAVLPVRPPSEPEADSSVLWVVFASGDAGAGELYEDDGVSLAYANGTSARTRLAHAPSPDGGTLTVAISAIDGSFAGAPTERRHIVQLRGAARAAAGAAVAVNGAALPFGPPPETETYEKPGWWVTPAALAQPWLAEGSAIIVLPSLPVDVHISIVVTFAAA